MPQSHHVKLSLNIMSEWDNQMLFDAASVRSHMTKKTENFSFADHEKLKFFSFSSLLPTRKQKKFVCYLFTLQSYAAGRLTQSNFYLFKFHLPKEWKSMRCPASRMRKWDKSMRKYVRGFGVQKFEGRQFDKEEKIIHKKNASKIKVQLILELFARAFHTWWKLLLIKTNTKSKKGPRTTTTKMTTRQRAMKTINRLSG